MVIYSHCKHQNNVSFKKIKLRTLEVPPRKGEFDTWNGTKWRDSHRTKESDAEHSWNGDPTKTNKLWMEGEIMIHV